MSERYQYLSDYRDSRVNINKSINCSFQGKLDNSKCNNVRVDMLLPYVEMNCQKDYIMEMANLKVVKEIGILNIIQNENVEIENIETSGSTAEYNVEPLDMYYTGSGIKVGVIDSIVYDQNAAHLQNADITSMGTQTGNSLTHSTSVLSILCGQLVENGGVRYQGVAPDSTVFFADNIGTNMQAFYWLIVENDVSVINLSLQIGTNEYDYGNIEKYIDCLVQQYRTVIINSAGNETNITSPGLAYNIITVGNMSNEKNSNNQYIINSNSSYDEDESLPNKPDMCAFGTNVHMVYNGNRTNLGSGTSFAAPMVTGTVALMMEANNELIGKPDAVKAILMNTADGEAVDASNNSTVYGMIKNSEYPNQSLWNFSNQMREKTGAGLLNIEGAVSMSLSNLVHRFAISREATKEEACRTIGEFYIEKDTDIEFTLVFEKPFDNSIEAISDVNVDFEIELYKDDERIMTTLSSFNNVESYRVRVSETGKYSFKIKCDKLNLSTDEMWELDDEDGNAVQHMQHEDFYVTFVVSCGCDLPSAEIQNCEKEGHDIVCNNCGYLFKELHNYATTTDNRDEVAIQYEVYYKVRQFNGNINDVICYYDAYPILTATDPSNGAYYIQEMSITDFRVDKRWDMLNFRICVVNYSTNELVYDEVSRVYVNLYYNTGECDFEETI